MKPKPIGIYLGDLYSSVGTFEYTGVPEVIANDHGNLSTPSYVAFVGDQQVLVGEAAYDQANTNPKNTVFAVNRFIGRMFEDVVVQEQIVNVHFSVVNVDGWPLIQVDNRKYSPKDICSMILDKLKQTAESYLAIKVTEAIIAVPDYFNNSHCISKVGLTVLRFIFESEAVTMTYNLDKLKGSEKNIVCILEMNHGKYFKASIVDCTKGYKLLSFKNVKNVNGVLTDKVNQLLRVFDGKYIKRKKIEQICDVCDLRSDITDISAIVLVCHTTRVFKFDSFFKGNFINRNVKIFDSIPHDKVFAYGATVQAAQIQNEYSTIDRLFRFDCTPLNIGIVVQRGIVCPVIERGTPIPTKKSKILNIPPFDCWIIICEGQCLFAQDNNYLEKLYIPNMIRKKIKIIFEIDVTGTLIVSTNPNNDEPIEIPSVKQRRTGTEIELMWEYAELHRVRDDYVRKRIGSTNELLIAKLHDKNYIYQTNFASNINRKYLCNS